MTKITLIGMLCIVSTFGLLAAPVANAQKVAEPAPAPVPVQVLRAKTVFISNAESTDPLQVPNLAYDEFYADVKAWGRYQLVATPADADLILAVRFEGGGLRLVISDPKTHVELWPLFEGVQGWNRQSTGRKNFTRAMDALVEDVKALTTSPSPSADNATPTK
jgi:hypothetical protein